MANGKCSTCKIVLTKDNCSPSVLKRGSHDCKSCRNSKATFKYRNDPIEREKESLRSKDKRSRMSSEQKRRQADSTFFYKYGVTVLDFNKRLLEQLNKCYICGVHLDASVNRKSPVRACQDHDHVSKKLRDILCNGCNLMLGYAKDNIEILKSAIAYLEKHSEGSTIQTDGLEAK